MSIFSFSRVLFCLLALSGFAGGLGWGTMWLLSSTKTAPDTRLATFYDAAEDIEMITLGSSHSVGIHFASVGVCGHSFYGGRMDIRSSLFKARVIMPYTENLRYIVIPVSPGTLTYDVPEWKTARKQWMANVPSPRWQSSVSIRERLFIKRAKIEHFLKPMRSARRLVTSKVSQYSTAHLSPRGQTTCTILPNKREAPDEAGIRHGYFRHALKAECISSFARKTVLGHAHVSQKHGEPAAQAKANNLLLLEELATRLPKDGDVQILLIAMPTSHEFYEAVSGTIDWPAEAAEYRGLDEKYANIRFLDAHAFFAREDYMPNNEILYDDDHLTVQGAMIFSQYLGKELGISSASRPVASQLCD